MIEMHQTTTKWFSRSGFHEVVFTKWFCMVWCVTLRQGWIV